MISKELPYPNLKMILGTAPSALCGSFGCQQVRICSATRRPHGHSANQGYPEEFLPLIHFALLGFSRLLARSLASLGFELYGKSDLRFMDGVYKVDSLLALDSLSALANASLKVLRDEFNYFPRLSREQFFSTGYAEQKMLLTSECRCPAHLLVCTCTPTCKRMHLI